MLKLKLIETYCIRTNESCLKLRELELNIVFIFTKKKINFYFKDRFQCKLQRDQFGAKGKI